MRIRFQDGDPKTVETAWLALGVFEGGRLASRALADDPRVADLLQKAARCHDFQGKRSECSIWIDPPGFAAQALVLFGLGPVERFDARAAFESGVFLAKRLGNKPRDGALSLLAPEAEALPDALSLVLQGLQVGSRDAGLSKSEPSRHAFEELVILGAAGSEAGSGLEKRAAILGAAVNQARHWVNLPPVEKPPAELAQKIEVEASTAGLEVEVWDSDRIRHERFGGLIGVSEGSEQPPRFVMLSWQGGAPNAPPLAWVGKGVTFDSGGLSIKPTSSMEDMKADMAGAAVVSAAAIAVARLELPINLRTYVPLTENMPGGRAMKLGDVLRMRNGKTVEIMNTDAEGRLILADALSYASERSPAALIDLATLTGACVVALGQRVAGLFSNDEGLAARLERAALATGERLWRLPLLEEDAEALKSPVADMKNVGGRWGGAGIAAKFLEAFVGETTWAHLDIAGPSWADNDSATQDAGGTGAFVRGLIRLAETWNEPPDGDRT